jgi:uncharacterized sulfatase
MFQTPTTQVWKRMYDQGRLEPPQTFFWETKPPEELYDLQNDPDEVNNLAGSAEHQAILERLRKAQQDWAKAIRDVGFLPEGEIHSRSQGSTAYEMGHDDEKYPLEKIVATAELASSLKPEATATLAEALEAEDSAVRYWAAMGILMRGPAAIRATKEALHKSLEDSSPHVRAIVAEGLARYGNQEDLAKALPVLLELADVHRSGVFPSMLALNALDALGERAQSAGETIRKLPKNPKSAPPRTGGYVSRLLQKIVSDLP